MTEKKAPASGWKRPWPELLQEFLIALEAQTGYGIYKDSIDYKTRVIIGARSTGPWLVIDDKSGPFIADIEADRSGGDQIYLHADERTEFVDTILEVVGRWRKGVNKEGVPKKVDSDLAPG